MENLFSANIAIHGENVNYQVAFTDERYTFSPEVSSGDFPAFSYRRENDEWHEQELVPPEIKKQAIEALEQYLMKQH